MNMMFKNTFFPGLFSLKMATSEYTVYSSGMWTFKISDGMQQLTLCEILLVNILYDAEVIFNCLARSGQTWFLFNVLLQLS